MMTMLLLVVMTPNILIDHLMMDPECLLDSHSLLLLIVPLTVMFHYPLTVLVLVPMLILVTNAKMRKFVAKSIKMHVF